VSCISAVKDMDDVSPSPVREDSSGNTSGLSDDEAPTSRHVDFETDAEHTLSCCILMLDVLLTQVSHICHNMYSSLYLKEVSQQDKSLVQHVDKEQMLNV